MFLSLCLLHLFDHFSPHFSPCRHQPRKDESLQICVLSRPISSDCPQQPQTGSKETAWASFFRTQRQRSSFSCPQTKRTDEGGLGNARSEAAQLGVIFDSSCATAAQAATVEHESDRPLKHGSRTAEADLQANLELSSSFFMQKLGNMDVKDSQVL
jgi:hypothetical protein